MTSPVPTIQSTGGKRSCFMRSPPKRPRQDAREHADNGCRHADCPAHISLELIQTMVRGLCAFLEAGDALIDRIELIAPHRQTLRECPNLRFNPLKFGE